MAEDLPSRELLKQLIERLDLLERVLRTNTARLNSIEQHLGIVSQRQSLHEPLADESGETHPATSQVKTQDLKVSEPTPTPATPVAPEPPIHAWSTTETPETPRDSFMDERTFRSADLRDERTRRSAHLRDERSSRSAWPTCSC